jgi:hypothetical protein
MKISKYENVFLYTNQGKHSFAGAAKPWVKRQNRVIIPMVLQRVELEEKARSSHFWVFG